MSVSFSTGIRKNRSARRLTARSMPPRVWLPPPARYDGAKIVQIEIPMRNVWMSEKTCLEACERREELKSSREYRLALAFLTDLYALALMECRKDSAPKDSAPKDLAPKDLAPKDLAPKDLAPKDLAPKDLAPKDLAPKGGEERELTKEKTR